LTEYSIREEIEYHDEKNDPYAYITYTKWYIREVIFPQNSNTISRVTYKAPYGHGGFIRNAGYIFGTGYNWKGPIGRMIVNITHDDNIILDHFNIGRFDKTEIKNYFSWEGNGMYGFEFNNIEPLTTDRIRLYVRECNMFNATGNEFGHYWENRFPREKNVFVSITNGN
jgi:hypothetical protein